MHSQSYRQEQRLHSCCKQELHSLERNRKHRKEQRSLEQHRSRCRKERHSLGQRRSCHHKERHSLVQRSSVRMHNVEPWHNEPSEPGTWQPKRRQRPGPVPAWHQTRT